MDKWKQFGSYEGWKSQNKDSLKADYDEYIDKEYFWVEPDTYVDFDDFCMGQWQRI